jgi:hypothetical protein
MIFNAKQHKYGVAQEQKVLPFLKEHFSSDIKTHDKWNSKHDFYDDYFNYELKSRTVKSTSFRDTLLAIDKIAGDKKLMFIFNYTDCLGFIVYDKQKFDGYEKKYVRGETKLHYMVPVSDLELIKTW